MWRTTGIIRNSHLVSLHCYCYVHFVVIFVFLRLIAQFCSRWFPVEWKGALKEENFDVGRLGICLSHVGVLCRHELTLYSSWGLAKSVTIQLHQCDRSQSNIVTHKRTFPDQLLQSLWTRKVDRIGTGKPEAACDLQTIHAYIFYWKYHSFHD